METFHLLLLVPCLVAAQTISKCRNENGSPRTAFPFTKPETCMEGIFYSCENGVEIRKICDNDGEVYNAVTGFCDAGGESVCSAAAVCPTNHVAGPHPNGYECEEDCIEMGMCWDNHTSKCLCKDSQNCPKDAPQVSRCHFSSAAEVHCHPAASLEVYADIASCGHFYLCIFGNRYHFACEDNLMFSKTAPSYCDTPENVLPPCGNLFF